MSIYATNPGKYRQRVTIQRPVVERDTVDGGVITNWVDFQTNVPAEFLTGPGREAVAANAEQAEGAARCNMRWFPGLLSSMRIIWDGKVYGIDGIPDTDSTGRREWRCKVSTGMSDGR